MLVTTMLGWVDADSPRRTIPGVAARPRPDGGRRTGDDDPLYPVRGQFSLGRPFGLLPLSDEVCTAEAVPFGLRQAVPTAAVPVGDLSVYGYDHESQLGIIRDGKRTVPLLRHTTGQTRTNTHPDGQKGPDSDTDHRED
jgi:putative ATP-grasp target RiPP